MKAPILLILLTSPFFAAAQKQAIVYSMPVYGKVSQVEKTNYNYFLNSKNELNLSPGFTKDIFFFDENQVLVKQQYLIDYSALDPMHKTKPKLSDVPVDPAKENKNAIPVSVEPAGSITENLYVYKYADGTKRMVGKQSDPPNFIMVGYFNKDGEMVRKDQYNKDSVRLASIQFSKDDTLSLREYDQRGNEALNIPFKKGVRQHASQRFEYAYDKRGNVTMMKQYDWNEDLRKWQAMYAYEYKYTYMKDQTGAAIAPPLAKSIEDELADAARINNGEDNTSSSTGADKEDGKQKKSLKERLNVFKKKD